ncbi:hypothetical protein [Roseomonas gilardii]|nr:hypothetical protein [Roseomonas gilardii]SUE43150.1 Uncharacterised protein [Roseomonas gilardii subsp. rosea]
MLSAQEGASSPDVSQPNIQDLARQFIAAIQNALGQQSATTTAPA